MKRGSRFRSVLVTLAMLSPGLAGFFGLFFYPMLVTVVRSLRPEGQQVGWTFEHYITFLSEPRARDVIFLTFELSISATICSILFSVPLCLALRQKLRGHRFFRLTMLVPRVVPGLIGALGLLLLLGSRGWVNLFLIQFVPFIHEPVRMNYTIPGLIFFYTWLYFPFTAVTTLSTLESLDPAIEEAAEVAGANRWQVLRHVIIPLIMPGILAGSVLTFMAAFGAFSIPLVAGGNYRPLAVEIYRQIDFTPARWSAASARAMIMAALQVAFLTVYMRILRRPAV
ncbi:MAG: ABC transporter permease subunit [Anaerolineae bacterium]|jgi:ABC-type Fe3+ transport system permease subunit|nr:ABC transporter permease subunit [Anaerolineae bacterium]MDH7473455.1 ABC transporter permease subunit [Anaerolineae bacterium]